jgi:hypothetical protein
VKVDWKGKVQVEITSLKSVISKLPQMEHWPQEENEMPLTSSVDESLSVLTSEQHRISSQIFDAVMEQTNQFMFLQEFPRCTKRSQLRQPSESFNRWVRRI